jgi:hypothetical protein
MRSNNVVVFCNMSKVKFFWSGLCGTMFAIVCMERVFCMYAMVCMDVVLCINMDNYSYLKRNMDYNQLHQHGKYRQW